MFKSIVLTSIYNLFEREELIMMLNDAIRQKIKSLCESNHLSVYELAKRSGIERNSISNFMNIEERYMTLTTLIRIIKVFDLNLSTFFADPIFRDIKGI